MIIHVPSNLTPLDFTINDLLTKRKILRYDSDGDLYTIHNITSAAASHALLSTIAPSEVWHHRLGHLGRDVMTSLQNSSFISCNKAVTSTCHTCRIGKHVRLPFSSSSSSTVASFQLVHCNLWTSPVLSISGFQYYLVLIDYFSHFYWAFPLHKKSEAFEHIATFHAYVQTQFDIPLQSIQADK